MPQTFQNYIDGTWTNSAKQELFEQRNPANLDEVTGCFQASAGEDAAAAIGAAQRAFPGWRSIGVARRAAILKSALAGMQQHADDLAHIVTRENGKTLRESHGEIASALREMEYQIHEGLRLGGETLPSSVDGVFAYSTRQPLGVVSIISPWNFPVSVPCRKLTPALMAGNTCILKPASLTPQVGLRITECFAEAGLPAGVLNLISGGGSSVGDALVTSPEIKAISFTGSTEVGRRIHEKSAKTMARTQLEMGGKNPMVVLEDADVVVAVSDAVAAGYACAGQWCTCTSRVIVHKAIAEEFKQRIVELVGKFVLGDGLNESTTMGPVCGVDQMNTVLKYIAAGREEGAQLLAGGGRLWGAQHGRGCFVAPTVFGNVTSRMKIAREEIFGPVLCIMEARDFDDALRIANDVDFGLASSIYTNDLKRAMTFLEHTDVGLTHVNMLTSHKEPQLTFGGIKCSGYGIPEAGHTGIEFFTEHKVAYVKYR